MLDVFKTNGVLKRNGRDSYSGVVQVSRHSGNSSTARKKNDEADAFLK